MIETQCGPAMTVGILGHMPALATRPWARGCVLGKPCECWGVGSMATELRAANILGEPKRHGSCSGTVVEAILYGPT